MNRKHYAHARKKITERITKRETFYDSLCKEIAEACEAEEHTPDDCGASEEETLECLAVLKRMADMVKHLETD